MSEVMTQNGSSPDAEAAADCPFPTSHPSTQLPRSSRAFEMFMSRAELDTMASMDSDWNRALEPESPDVEHSFPRPSHLEGSHYLSRLDAQERRKAQLQKESGNQAAGGHAFGSRGKHQPPTTFHLGIALDVVERSPAPDLSMDTVDPLPTRWGTGHQDRPLNLEVMGSGLEVKLTGPRGPNENNYEACAIRTDHPMPLQCGLYYYEVTILTKTHIE